MLENNLQVLGINKEELVKDILRRIGISENTLEKVISLLKKNLIPPNQEDLKEISGIAKNFFKEAQNDFNLFGNLIGATQSPVHHKEGDIATHTLLVLVNSLRLCFEYFELDPEFNRDRIPEFVWIVVLAALFHDISKPRVNGFFLHPMISAKIYEAYKFYDPAAAFAIKYHSIFHILVLRLIAAGKFSENRLLESATDDKPTEHPIEYLKKLVEKYQSESLDPFLEELKNPNSEGGILPLIILCAADAASSLLEDYRGLPYPELKELIRLAALARKCESFEDLVESLDNLILFR